jgi:hypothetical protein
MQEPDVQGPATEYATTTREDINLEGQWAMGKCVFSHVYASYYSQSICFEIISWHHKQYIHTNLLLYCSKKFYKFNQVSNNESEQRNFTHLIRCQAMKLKPYIILNTSRKHVNYEEDKNKHTC